jgi:hypothetical protein
MPRSVPPNRPRAVSGTLKMRTTHSSWPAVPGFDGSDCSRSLDCCDVSLKQCGLCMCPPPAGYLFEASLSGFGPSNPGF